MASSTWFAVIKSTPTSGFLFIVPVCGQKVKGIGPSALEVLIRSREQEPTGSTYGTAITARLRHDF
jgi:hypothetical protein